MVRRHMYMYMWYPAWGGRHAVHRACVRRTQGSLKAVVQACREHDSLDRSRTPCGGAKVREEKVM